MKYFIVIVSWELSGEFGYDVSNIFKNKLDAINYLENYIQDDIANLDLTNYDLDERGENNFTIYVHESNDSINYQLFERKIE